MNWFEFIEKKYQTKANIELAGYENAGKKMAQNKTRLGIASLLSGSILAGGYIGDIIFSGYSSNEAPLPTFLGIILITAGIFLLVKELIRFWIKKSVGD